MRPRLETREPGHGPWRITTYGEALRAARGVAQSLLERGMGPDDAVRILLINKEAGEGADVTLELGDAVGASSATVVRLISPSLLARENIQLAGSSVGADGTWSPSSVDTIAGESGQYSLTIPPASAALVTVAQPASTAASTPARTVP